MTSLQFPWLFKELRKAFPFAQRIVRVDFKIRDTIGAPGVGLYTTNLTIAPWKDSSAGMNHQFTFHNGGIYFRQGLPGNTEWNEWRKVMLETENGNVGIGVTAPTEKLEISGNVKAASLISNTVKAEGEEPHLNIQTEFGYVKIGAMNKHYAHFRTNKANYWVDKPVIFNSGKIGSFSNDNLYLRTGENSRITVAGLTGYVGIGTLDPQNLLDVNGIMRAKELVIETTGWSDFVFADDYELRSLEEVKLHIDANKHLPDIPSEKEVLENGISVGEMQSKLLQKIEELTLYIIQQQEAHDKLKAEVDDWKRSK